MITVLSDRKALIKALCAIFFALLLPLSLPISASANSAQMEWSGADATGAIVTDTSCPITVKNERLVFNLPAFPSTYYSTAEELSEYSASVTAIYEFYNPADYNVSATLAFPFGAYPDYVSIYNEQDGHRYTPVDTDGYDVKVNGEAIEKAVRHTLLRSRFDAKEEMKWLKSERVSIGLYTPETKVTKYVYRLDGAEKSCFASARFRELDSSRAVILNANSYSRVSDSIADIATWLDPARGETEITVYCIGAPFTSELTWVAYDSGKREKELDCSITLTSQTEITFSELIMSSYPEDGTISETDWYNAVVCNLYNGKEEFGFVGEEYLLDVSDALMRWYVYDIEIEAGGTLTNEVSAPIYPARSDRYTPPKFTYTYLLSPASTWAGFGELSIEIVTPYYLLQSSEPGFEKTDSGYSLTRNGLPMGELEFTLCASDSPERTVTPYTVVGDLIFGSIIGVFIAIIAGAVSITVVVIIISKKKKD
ncbi:MAG: hypothetical protein IJY04_07190 [Clostridia bacterium]|nr:hypothetical protein [Clostridia bacterium]